MTELNSCPFCGGEPSSHGYSVTCDGCGAQVIAPAGTADRIKGRAKVLKAWNKRHIPAITDEDVERAWAGYIDTKNNGQTPIDAVRAALTAFIKGLNQ